MARLAMVNQMAMVKATMADKVSFRIMRAYIVHPFMAVAAVNRMAGRIVNDWQCTMTLYDHVVHDHASARHLRPCQEWRLRPIAPMGEGKA